MDKLILCEFNLFTALQKIAIIDDQDVKIVGKGTIDNLPQLICDIADTNNISEVHLIGSSIYATEKLIPAIYTLNESKYSHHPIHISLN